MKEENKKIRVGVIGAGKMSQKTHLPIISRLKDDGIYELVVICDLNIDAAKKASDKFSFENYIHDTEKIFEYNLDALYVFGTTQIHYDFALKALQKDINVFIEKPPAPSTDHFKQLVKLASGSSAVGVVGFNRRFQKNIETIKEEISGTGLYAMEAVFHKPVVDEAPPHGAKTWFPINAIHSLDLLLYIKGSLPKTIQTATNSVNTKTPQNFSVLLTWQDGAHAVLSSDYSAGARMERYVFHGHDTSYEVDLTSEPKYTKSKGGVSNTVTEDHTVKFRGFDGEHDEFANAIISGDNPRHSFKECLGTVYLTELIEKGFSGEVPPLSPGEKIEESPQKQQNQSAILVLNSEGLKQHLPKLKESFQVVFPEDLEKYSDSQRSEIKAMITGPGGVPITADLIDQLPNLEIAGIIGASLKKYNTEALVEKGIHIFNASDSFAESVAEFIVMQAIAGVREATKSHDIMRAGGWGLPHTPKMSIVTKVRKIINRSALAPVKKLLKPLWNKATKVGIVKPVSSSRPVLLKDFRGSTFGIIGFGEITKKLIPYLHTFGCTVKIHSDYLTEENVKKYNVEKCSIDVALNCDVVSLLRGLSPRTQNSFGKDEFSALKQGAVFINASRAGIINEQEMLSALKENTFFACLDVFHKEPLQKNSILRSLPNVFLTSHIAACSIQMRNECTETVVNKVTNYLLGNEVEDVIVNKELLKNMT